MKKYITFAKETDEKLPFEDAHRNLAYRAASESIVLLKNDGALPVKTDGIALYGAGAAMTIKGGTGSGEVNERHSTTIWEGMLEAGFDITTEKWLKDYIDEYENGLKEVEEKISKAMKKLDLSTYMGLFLQSYTYPVGRPITMKDVEESETDTCIYVIARQSGEGHDRKLEEFQITEEEKEHIRFCAKHYEKTIVVLNVGSSFDVSFLDEIPGINALLYFCQQGTAGGTAFAHIINGRITPSGKLTDTWVKSYNDVPFGKDYSYLNGNLEEEDYKESIYVGYRYYDSFNIEPRFPFGYGLSYTDFKISYQRIMLQGDCVFVTVHVKNTGDTYSGKEIVQLYASCPSGKLDKEYQRLVAFGKTRLLAPGEDDIVILVFPLNYLASYNPETNETLMENGTYLLRLGSHSRNTDICAAIELKDDIVFSKHKAICPLSKPMDILKTDALNTAVLHHLNSKDILKLDTDTVETIVYDYSELPVTTDRNIFNQLKSLKPHERIELVVGAGLKDMLMNSSYVKVPGVAGNTTSKFIDKGIPNIALADGPAGIRIQKRSTITKNGTAKMIDMQLDMMKHFPNAIKKIFCGNEEKDKIYYQFTTAFPVANAMAQTWNEDLWIEMGHAVGEEMEEYGITYWLAPGVNIHRNPLCGRNFEYYSEDPILSGLIAGSITHGVQSVPGRFVTLKHFCANNQEENRNHVSSNVDERALREIYLKPFEIAITESHSKGLMTSYNKLNGVYTSNSKDLLTHVLRNEWAFDGLAMTDWTTTAKGQSDPALCMAAGNDLIMPGFESDKKRIKKAVMEGTLSTRDVNRCTANVLKAIASNKVIE